MHRRSKEIHKCSNTSSNTASQNTRQLWQAVVMTSIPCTSSMILYNNNRLILIIFGKLHQHTSKNDMYIQLSLPLQFYLFYLHLNSCDGNDAKQCVFLRQGPRLLVALKSADLVQQMFKVMYFCLHACTQLLSPLTNSFDVL